LDFWSRYENRQRILRTIQASQASESAALQRISQTALQGKAALLWSLSDWLLRLRATPQAGAALEREWAMLTGASLSLWLRLQAVASQLEMDLAQAVDVEQTAQEAYERAAPSGYLSKLSADTPLKVRIKHLEAAVRAARTHRVSVEAKQGANDAERITLGDRFLRDCLARLDILLGTRTFGTMANRILSAVAQEMNAAWHEHARQDNARLRDIAGTLRLLPVMPVSQMPRTTVILPPTPATTAPEAVETTAVLDAAALQPVAALMDAGSEEVTSPEVPLPISIAWVAPDGRRGRIPLMTEHVVTIGRLAENVISLPADKFASGRHAVVAYDAARDEWTVRDLDSRNGTHVNEESIRTRTVRIGDIIRVGGTLLNLESLGEE